MIIGLPPLYTKIIALLPKGRYKYVTAPTVIAVCLQESGGDPVFSLEDYLCQLNLKAAAMLTTLPEELLIDALKIQSGDLQGQIAKFRFEPAYWEWTATKKLQSVSLRFLCSCSLGLGQQMMRWVLPANAETWEEFIESFKGDTNLQLKWVIEDLERLLDKVEGDLLRAYKGYNSGNVNSTNPDVVERAKKVVALRDKVQLQLQG